MSRSFLNFDERNVNTTCRICAIMYGITWMMLAGVLLYRQFVLGQPVSAFQDIAIIFTFNVIVAFSAVLYFGGITFPRIKPLYLVGIYVGFVLIGVLFTLFKYAVLLDRPVGMEGMRYILLTVSPICGAFVAVYALFAYLGTRKIDREIE